MCLSIRVVTFGSVVPGASSVDDATVGGADGSVDVVTDAVSTVMRRVLGGIGVGTFSAGSAGAAYKNQLFAGFHGRAWEVGFFGILAAVYLVSVGEMLAAARCVSLDGTTAKKITFISFLLLVVLLAFGLVGYYYHNSY